MEEEITLVHKYVRRELKCLYVGPVESVKEICEAIH